MCLFKVRAAGWREYERRAFVAHKLLLLQPQQVAVVRLGSLCSSSHTAKNFAFIFDIQAQVRLFLPCGSPCVRSTSDCAVLLRSRRTKDGGIIREMSLSMRVPLVASNELAIVTKSIAFVSPPRTTDNLVENCPYLSGGRNTGVSGKRGTSNLGYKPPHSCRGRTRKRPFANLPSVLEVRDGGAKGRCRSYSPKHL